MLFLANNTFNMRSWDTFGYQRHAININIISICYQYFESFLNCLWSTIICSLNCFYLVSCCKRKSFNIGYQDAFTMVVTSYFLGNPIKHFFLKAVYSKYLSKWGVNKMKLKFVVNYTLKGVGWWLTVFHSEKRFFMLS